MSVKKLTSGNNKSLVIQDSSNNKYYIYAGRTGVGYTSRLTVQPDDLLSELGYGDSSLGNVRDLIEFDVPSDGTVALALNKSPYISLIPESEWTKVISSGEFTYKFWISGWDLGLSGAFTQIAKINNRFLCVTQDAANKGAAIVKGDVMVGAYSGAVSLNTLRTNGDAYIISYIGDTKDFNIVPSDVGNTAWNSCATIEGSDYVIFGTSLGLFCIDFSDPDIPVYNGKLTATDATGIFSEMSILSGSTDIVALGSGQTLSNRYIAFATADTLFIYDEVLGDGSPPTGVDITSPSNQQVQVSRSEERRVGKECRSRWSPYH